jgi:hypothetical protein
LPNSDAGFGSGAALGRRRAGGTFAFERAVVSASDGPPGAAKYDSDWHVRHRERNSYSAERIVDLLMPMLSVRSVVDFGCGDGVWLRTFERRGIERIMGYDGPWTDIGQLQIDPVSFRSVDFTTPVPAPEPFDLALCLEVGEHLPPGSERTLVRSIAEHAPVVLFGAAIPQQGGYRHVNERWQSFWSGLFEEQGYLRFDFIRSRIWEDPDVYFWYKQNIGLFVREDQTETVSALRSAIEAGKLVPMPLDVVHPDLYRAISTYDQIAFKPLLRKIFPAIVAKVQQVVKEGLRGVR